MEIKAEQMHSQNWREVLRLAYDIIDSAIKPFSLAWGSQATKGAEVQVVVVRAMSRLCEFPQFLHILLPRRSQIFGCFSRGVCSVVSGHSSHTIADEQNQVPFFYFLVQVSHRVQHLVWHICALCKRASDSDGPNPSPKMN